MAIRTLEWLPNTADTGGWKARHMQEILRARNNPPSLSKNHAIAMVRAFDAWIDYALAHQKRFDSPIGEDYVLGPAWARWGFALRELLNGEAGSLDCGTLDSILCHNLTEMGFDPDEGAP